MKSKGRSFLMVMAAISGLVLGGIHLAFQGEIEKVGYRADMSMARYNEAVAECRVDPIACPTADLEGSFVDRDLADLEAAKQQAWLLLGLAFAVPAVLVAAAVIWGRLARPRAGAAVAARLTA